MGLSGRHPRRWRLGLILLRELAMASGHAAHLVLALLLVLAVTGCQTAEVEPPTYELFFCADHAVHLASIEPDGTVQVGRVLDLPEDSVCPMWSPDGRLALLYRFRDERPIIRDSLNLIERSNGIVHELYDLGPRDA